MAIKGYFLRNFVGREANTLKGCVGKLFYLLNSYGWVLGTICNVSGNRSVGNLKTEARVACGCCYSLLWSTQGPELQEYTPLP